MPIRTTTLRVKNTEAKTQLFKVFKDYTNVCSIVNRRIFEMSQKPYKNKFGTIVMDSRTLVVELEKGLDRPLTTEETKALENVFTDFSNALNARDFSNAFTLPIRNKTLKEDDEKSGKKAGEVKTIDSQSLVLCKQTFPSLLPLTTKGSEFDILHGQSGYKYSVFGSILNRLSSWQECDKETNKEYNDLNTQLSEETKHLIDTYGQAQFDALMMWLSDVDMEFNKNPKTLTKFGFNWKFANFFTYTLKPELLKWKENHTHKVPNTGKWLTKDEKHITYSCGKYVIDLLKEFIILWEYEKTILSYKNLGDYIELREKFDRKKDHSSYKDIDIINSPIKLMMGNNYVSITNLQHDVQNGVISLTIGYPKSLKVDNKKSKMVLECSYRRVGRGQHHYLENLVIEETKNEKDAFTGNYKLSFKINGKKERVALLKEPSIRLVILNNKMDFNNPRYSDFDFYIDLTMNVEVKSTHGIDIDALWKYRAALSRAFPEIKSFGNQKTLPKDTVVIPDGMRVMGVDLGLKNPYAWSIYEYDSNGQHKFVAEGLTDSCKDDYYKIYSELGWLCESVRRIISNTKRHVNDGEDLDEGNFKTMLTNLEKLDSNKTFSFDDYKKFVADKIASGVSILDFKKDESWLVRKMFNICRTILLRLKNERFNNHADWRKHFFWIRALESYRKMAMSYYGTLGKQDKENLDGKNQPKFKIVHDVRFKKIYDEIDGLKLDYIKKMTSKLAEIANVNKAAIVVVEELENLRGNKFGDRDKNQLFNLWPVGQVKKFLSDSLEIYGILVGNAFEGNTSQVDANTGEWGYRGKKDEIDQLYLPDDKVVNADVNASKNICLRYLNQHTDSRCLSMYRVDDTYYVPTVCVDDKESKRVSGFLSKQFGGSKIVFEKSGDVLVLSNISLQELKKKKRVVVSNKETWYALDNTFKKWITKDQREGLIEKIKQDHGK
jgi:IS605 OrfB family transposase